jgi:Zn finger protein HypA/HybF involved in hydrogenase expression
MGDKIKPNVAKRLENQMDKASKDYSKEELEEKDLGFYCTNCDYRSYDLKISSSDDFEKSFEDLMNNVCPKCEEDALVNSMSEQKEELKEIYQNYDGEWVPLDYLRKKFSFHKDRFEEVMNNLIVRNNAHIILEDQIVKIKITN